MFFIFGTTYEDDPIEPRVEISAYCPKCKTERKLIKYKSQKFYHIFFAPIYKSSEEPQSFLKCVTCEGKYEYIIPELEKEYEKREMEIYSRSLKVSPSKHLLGSDQEWIKVIEKQAEYQSQEKEKLADEFIKKYNLSNYEWKSFIEKYHTKQFEQAHAQLKKDGL